MASTCSAPLSASWIACRPLPQPTSRQRPPRPTLLVEQVAPDQERALRRGEDVALGDEVREGQRVQGAPGRIDPRLGRRRMGAAELVGPPCSGARCAPRLAGQRRARGADLLGPDAAAAADQLCALLAPAHGHAGELVGPGVGVDVPAVAREVADVGVHAERQVGEVAQVREHPVDVVGRDAAEQQGADAELLEATHGAPEGVALRAAPVLAVDAAQPVAAAPERQPHGQADGSISASTVACSVGPMTASPSTTRRSGGSSASARPAGGSSRRRRGGRRRRRSRRRPQPRPRAAPRPPPGARAARFGARARASAGAGRRRAPSRAAPGVGGDDVAAGPDVAPVQRERRGRHARPAAGGPAVEDHAALRRQRLAHHVVGRWARARGSIDRPAALICMAAMTAALPRPHNRARTLNLAGPRPSSTSPSGGLCTAPGRFRALVRRNRTWSVPRVAARCPISTSSQRSPRPAPTTRR